ncbi:hypothetical protein [Virgibacillus pantothenticus]|uniref:hypothetical protein n=1 Tax=Virgibacillus pantothenticus TaxID=1473 RepID=UPI00098669CC|nr:hypothetical protein [Virgibacillus pantothenticus]
MKLTQGKEDKHKSNTGLTPPSIFSSFCPASNMPMLAWNQGRSGAKGEAFTLDGMVALAIILEGQK